MNGPDAYVPFPATVTVEDPSGAPEHAASFGPNAVNVIVPVGLLTPPERTPESLIVPPAGTDPDAVVTIAGVAFVTVTDSFAAPHPEVAGPLFPSPL